MYYHSKQTFSKYSKMKYNLKPIIHSTVKSLFKTTIDSRLKLAGKVDTLIDSLLGYKYFVHQMKLCCDDSMKYNEQETPFQLIFYVRLARLYDQVLSEALLTAFQVNVSLSIDRVANSLI